MADVLLLCLKEDEAAAQSLAATFERAGLSVDGSDGTDEEVARAAAVLVLWTPAAARSPGMRAAAQNVLRSGKALYATFGLMKEPPPSGARAFDLAKWTGDPDDVAIDGLFVAVDRLVARARELVFTQADRAPAPAPTPQPPRAPGYHQVNAERETARAPVERPRPPQPVVDPLAEEAAAWRSIRDSDSIADFETFLMRFGRDGAFAELAIARLEKLRAAAVAPRERRVEPVRREPPAREYREHSHFGYEPERPAPRPLESRQRLDPPGYREPPRPLPSYDRGGQESRGDTSGGGRALALATLLVAALAGGGFYLVETGRAPNPFAAEEPVASRAVDEEAARASAASDAAAEETQAAAAEEAPLGMGGPDVEVEPVPAAPPSRAAPARQTPQASDRDLDAAYVPPPAPQAYQPAPPPEPLPFAYGPAVTSETGPAN